MINRLEIYSNINAGSGNEDKIVEQIKKDIKDKVKDIEINPIGNLIARLPGKTKNNVLLTAHMDEVSLMVRDIEENGLIKFSAVGGFIPKILPATQVIIGNKKIPGAIAIKTLHFSSAAELSSADEIRDMYIDIGASSKAEANGVQIGDYIYFTSKFFKQGSYLFGKAFDDRAGCCAITEAILSGPYETSIYASYNVSEEVGLRGGYVCAFDVENLLFNLNLEGTTCSDREIEKTYSPSTELGKGPAFTIMDNSSIANRKLLDFAIEVAKKNKIPYQFKRTVTGGTDSGAIALTQSGVASITLSVPVRYIHSPWSIIHEEDYKNYIKLAIAIVKEAHNFKS
ncbi:MAG: M42 family metallopeptidase [Spirochaetales bacterium]|nr:M42 family metallopeptidase [Spirochaetales bacterium]